MSKLITFKNKAVGVIMKKRIAPKQDPYAFREYAIAYIASRDLNDELICYLKESGFDYVMDERSLIALHPHLPTKTSGVWLNA